MDQPQQLLFEQGYNHNNHNYDNNDNNSSNNSSNCSANVNLHWQRI